MTTLVQGTYGGEVRWTGGRRLEADYPHLPITVMLMIPVTMFFVSGLVMVFLSLWLGPLTMLVPAAIGVTAGAFLGIRARERWTSMGRFVVDVDQGLVTRHLLGRLVDQVPLTDVVGVTSRWDPLHRDFGKHFWLLVETRQGRAFRLGKGTEAEVGQALALLQSWGLPRR